MMHKNYARTLEKIPDNATEVWTFDTSEARQATMRALKEQGHSVILHSAYKTLLYNVLECGLLDGAQDVLIRYPVIDGDEPTRFLLECYPLSNLVSAPIGYEPFTCQFIEDDDNLPYYELIIDGTKRRLFVPVRWVTRSTGARQLVACGWVKLDDGCEQPLFTEYEHIFDDVCAYVDAMPIADKKPPFFDRLSIKIGLPMRDKALPVGGEHLSLIEAMHEDIYFTALEIFQQRLGLPAGDRGVRPGQIFPNVFYAESPSLSIAETSVTICEDMDDFGCPDLATTEHWLTPKQIESSLNTMTGEPFSVTSRQGRVVLGRLIGDVNAPVRLAISGGQHANESSGVVGALRAGLALQHDSSVAMTLCPSENVDGYAGFRQLCQDNPTHMHHAARYTAAGNDLTHSDTYESAIRARAQEKLNANVHINLHGYPAHEWTRPLSGYIPEGFAEWTIPKGFFLICRHHANYEALAKMVLNVSIQAIAEHPEQMRVNRAMMKRYLSLITTPDFEVAHEAIPHMTACRNDGKYPVEIITEAPDETIYGEDFRIAHESQFRVIMAISKFLKNEHD